MEAAKVDAANRSNVTRDWDLWAERVSTNAAGGAKK
jgi:hypothetical protein